MEKLENQQIERNVATKIKSFVRFPSEIIAKPKTKCSAVGRTTGQKY
jgi:hypothetical protein